MKLEDLAPEDRTALPYNHPLLNEYADRVNAELGLPKGMVNAIKNVGERSGSTSVSGAKARGVMQTIPSTQKELGIEDPTDPVQSINGGARYLAQMSKSLNTTDYGTLAAAYHAGPNSRTVKGDFEGSPKTAAYVKRVQDFATSLVPAATAVAAPAPAPAPQGLTAADLNPEDRVPHGKGPDPTGSFGENALAGVGKAMVDLGSGVRQVGAAVLNPVAQKLTGKDILNPDFEGEAERARLDAPLMDTAGGNTGYIGANALTLALPGAALTQAATKAVPILGALTKSPAALAALAKYAPAALSSAGLTAFSPTTKEGDRATNMAVSAAISPMFQKGAELVGRAVRPVTEWVGDRVNLGPLLRKSWGATANPEQKQVVTRAMMNDVPVYASQLDVPGSAVSKGRSEKQLKALTQAFNRTFGEETPDIAGAMSTANTRLGDTYKALLDGKTVHLNTPSGPAPANGLPGAPGVSPYIQTLLDIRDRANKAAPMMEPPKDLNDAIERALAYAHQGGTLTGRQYQDMLRDYAASANRALKGNILTGTKSSPLEAKGFSALASALEHQAGQVMSPAEQAAFKTANRQFRNMKTLESLNPVKVDGMADFNPTSVAKKLARADKNAFIYNRGDTTQSDLGKFGATYMGLDANAPNSLYQRAKGAFVHHAPTVAGDAALALAAGATLGNDEGSDTAAEQALKYGLLMLGAHGVLSGVKRGTNPRLTMGELNAPRGALAETWRRMNFVPGMTSALMREEESKE